MEKWIGRFRGGVADFPNADTIVCAACGKSLAIRREGDGINFFERLGESVAAFTCGNVPKLDGAVCTSGGVVCRPGIVTSVVETAEQLLDQRHLSAESLARMLSLAKEASERFAREENVDVSWERIWSIEPILFDERLIELADESIRAVSGTSHRRPSGPLHDAAEVARAGVPTVMVFVQSLRGLSHTKLEDTKEEHLELSVAALDRLASKTLHAYA